MSTSCLIAGLSLDVWNGYKRTYWVRMTRATLILFISAMSQYFCKHFFIKKSNNIASM